MLLVLVTKGELSTPPAETQKPLAPSPDESVEIVTLSGNGPDASVLSADYATEELLAQYESYGELAESDYKVRLAFKFVSEVKDFRLLMLRFDKMEEDKSLNFCVEKTLCYKETVSPETPIVVGTVFVGSLPTRAISFVDENNTTRYFDLSMSGEDGSIILIELVPR